MNQMCLDPKIFAWVIIFIKVQDGGQGGVNV